LTVSEFSLSLHFTNLNNMPKIETPTPEELIVKHLEDNGQKLSWLANKVGVTVGHLHSVLKGVKYTKRELTEANRMKINEALGTHY
jgi:hypothetical protein